LGSLFYLRSIPMLTSSRCRKGSRSNRVGSSSQASSISKASTPQNTSCPEAGCATRLGTPNTPCPMALIGIGPQCRFGRVILGQRNGNADGGGKGGELTRRCRVPALLKHEIKAAVCTRCKVGVDPAISTLSAFSGLKGWRGGNRISTPCFYGQKHRQPVGVEPLGRNLRRAALTPMIQNRPEQHRHRLDGDIPAGSSTSRVEQPHGRTAISGRSEVRRSAFSGQSGDLRAECRPSGL
jgi:hypothetical protein